MTTPTHTPHRVRLVASGGTSTDLGTVAARWDGPMLELANGLRYGPCAVWSAEPVEEPAPDEVPPLSELRYQGRPVEWHDDALLPELSLGRDDRLATARPGGDWYAYASHEDGAMCIASGVFPDQTPHRSAEAALYRAGVLTRVQPALRLSRRAAAYGIAALCDAADIPRPSVCDDAAVSDADDESTQARACAAILSDLADKAKD